MPKKIVYLFGAGATHAELAEAVPDWENKQRGLLISHVSDRVMAIASGKDSFRKGLESVSGTSGSLNIELLISLIENSRVKDWAVRTRYLKKEVEKDIKGILTESLHKRFYLHRGLLELHNHSDAKRDETLSGLISLNYDDVLDRAYVELLEEPPPYCFSAGDPLAEIPLLKLHGSFNWKKMKILSRKRDIDIIPLGAAKTYIHSPYGAIWNRALFTLADCDTLRVIGSSLSPNDLHLIDLLFKAQLERASAFEIEIIADDTTGDIVKRNYGFFGKSVKRLSDLGVTPSITGPGNPFKAWLLYRADRLLGSAGIQKSRYLKKLTR